MDLSTLLEALRRRWYVTVPAVLLVIAVALSVVNSAEPEYSATRSVVLVRTGLLPPDAVVTATVDPAEDTATDDATADEATTDDATDASDEPVPRNPYTEFTASVGITAEVLQEVALGGDARQALRQEGLSDDYTVGVDDDAPILVIEATAASPAVAIESAEEVARIVADDLEARQDRFEVPDESRIVTDDVVVPDRTTRNDTARNRALIGVAVLGTVFVVALTLTVDLFALSRGGRRERSATPADGDDDATPGAGDTTEGLTARLSPRRWAARLGGGSSDSNGHGPDGVPDADRPDEREHAAATVSGADPADGEPDGRPTAR